MRRQQQRAGVLFDIVSCSVVQLALLCQACSVQGNMNCLANCLVCFQPGMVVVQQDCKQRQWGVHGTHIVVQGNSMVSCCVFKAQCAHLHMLYLHMCSGMPVCASRSVSLYVVLFSVRAFHFTHAFMAKPVIGCNHCCMMQHLQPHHVSLSLSLVQQKCPGSQPLPLGQARHNI